MPSLRDAYRGAVATWKNDLFKITVRPMVIAGLVITAIDAIRAVYNHDLSRLGPLAFVWLFLGPFLFIWWRRNKA